MKKKLLSIGLVAVIAIAAIAGASLAYLTDTDEADNVFTIGNIQIQQNEQQRNADGTALEAFTDDKLLMPIVGSAQGEKDEWGMPVAANYVDKIVTVENTGEQPAYIRTFVAVPAATQTGEDGNPTFNALHWNYGNRVDLTGNGLYNDGGQENWNRDFLKWDWESAQTVGEFVEGGVKYALVLFNYTEALPAGAETAPIISGLYLDKAVNFDGTDYIDPYGNKIDNFIEDDGKVHIYCYTQAVQAPGFDTAAEAFDAAQLPYPYLETPAN